ncbi:GDP-mannose-dependent alpha-(1-2)-phosphatidylinositol mannosyltransferase [Corynebacterium kutscheri]|uniref:GDP-mannose-dependent alpha-(1-2)-phosphatidylinositol mannosyltransferase n=1 Tax=Corynebacterium kutscheri TaxID=35755 RepID=A0A0F6QZV4_9CORY|nr:glycosyltransferase family 4 protein [Corynebacterium kutscheri]AKE41352.1 glycosyltransferase [Corynebacterium kutscheri]VEH08628.1 GDP-mannose-dependent alpha-(1-2)-phosphatidylinositol mannosyltransferase [Corynebacterium kutscheri]VEH09674.1 GDP-mannose-dependent alpha-(1-2)-phosphatidylinositol mannosyltransferase [Corynebacterium kutscheri]VEH79757.1 GDP-mannose-dependent alpha-(1-2)-phosphatidylinositol mannosyltransferase [Corynebacterium kutscheri]
MRIGIICPYSFDEPGGVQAHIIDLSYKLQTLGHEVGVLGPCSDTTEVPDFVTKGGSSIPIPYNGSIARLSFGPQVLKIARQFINDGEFDVLHIHEPNSPSFSLAALRVAQGPVVATYHASSSGSKLLKVVLPFLRGSLEKIRGGIAVSEMARRWQVEQLGGDPILIPNGVETRNFRRAIVTDDKKLPIEIVFLGRIDEPRKGLDILLAALPEVQHQIKVTVIGGGTPRKVPGYDVNFVGRVSDEEKAAILGRADIYVAPNTGGESFGIVLVEAMAARCVVVASDIEAFQSVCDIDSETPAGVVFRNHDSHDLARVLNKVIADKQLHTQLLQAGDARADFYDWDNVAREIVRVYETVLDGQKVVA